MTLDYLYSNLGYILFIFDDGYGFYIYTSFDSKLCPKPEYKCIYDLLSCKHIPQRIFKDAKYQVFELEPVSWKEESEFIKQFI